MLNIMLNWILIAVSLVMMLCNLSFSQQFKKAIVINAEEKKTEIKIKDYDKFYFNVADFECFKNKNACDTFNMYEYENLWTVTSYYSGSTLGADGWVNGLNVYGDKAKANYFSNSGGYPMILGVYIAFNRAWSSNPQKTISVNIYSNAGGSPGSIIASKTITMQNVIADVTNNYFTKVMFDSPISVSGAFFAGVDFSNLTWGGVYDTLSIQCNTDGETVPSQVWEKQSDNLWYQYGTTYSFNLDISLAIFPIVTDFPAVASFSQSTNSTCPGFNVNFDASASVQNSVQWIFQGGNPASSNILNPTVTYNNSGTWPVKLYVLGGSCNNLDSAISQINILSPPNPSATAIPDTICEGQSSTLSAYNAILYSWSGQTSGLNPVTVSPVNTTTYIVNVTGSNACTASQQVVVKVNPLPNVTACASPSVILPGASSLINAAPGFFDYQWSNGNTSAAFVIYPVSDTTLYVTVTDNNNCVNTDSVDVVIDPTLSINENIIKNDLTIFPNPCDDFLEISYKGNESIDELELYDISGRLFLSFNEEIYRNKNMILNISILPKGLYILKFKSANNCYYKKLMVL